MVGLHKLAITAGGRADEPVRLQDVPEMPLPTTLSGRAEQDRPRDRAASDGRHPRDILGTGIDTVQGGLEQLLQPGWPLATVAIQEPLAVTPDDALEEEGVPPGLGQEVVRILGR